MRKILIIFLCFTFVGCKQHISGDAENGYGVYIRSGSKYEGELKDGMKDGYGTFTWADGTKYIGEFKGNKQNGQGTYTTADGTVYKGIWKNGYNNSKKRID
jgi:hypothetical protein